jgi:AraC-like DNA-binding protein
MAAVADVSTYRFAHQFKHAAGLPTYQYVIGRRVERVERLPRAGTDLSLAEIAARASFSDQSDFCRHFERLVGITPARFRMHIRIAEQAASPSTNLDGKRLGIPQGRGGSAGSRRRRAPIFLEGVVRGFGRQT